MFKADTDNKRIEDFPVEKIKQANISEKLTIIDSYFFSKGKFGHTINLIKNIDDRFRGTIKSFEIVTSKRNFNRSKFEELKNNLGEARLKVTIENLFHDRFWIIDERIAFVVGTSINGFGTKHFFIQDEYLSSKDTKTILSIYKDIN